MKHLVIFGLKNFTVMDTGCNTTCTSRVNIGTRITELDQVTAQDGAHLVSEGIKKT
jgi:hypothetical protein